MRLAVFGTIAAAVAGFAAYDNYDKNTNFQPVDARISAVSSQRRRQPRTFFVASWRSC
jgi:hypothetical protein